MKILLMTDTHVSFKNPASRLDVFSNTILNKFNEIGNIIKQNNIDLVLHGGDFFHSPTISLKFAGTIANILRSWNIPIYVVPGNHDVVGYNTKTLDQTMLGFYYNTGVVKPLMRSKHLQYNINGKILNIEGQEYYKDIDTGNNQDYMCFNKGDLNILVVHSMLLEKPFIEGIAHTVIKDVKSNADIIYTGHYHPGYKTVTVDGTTFINNGSLLRVESSRKEIPSIVILDIDDETFKYSITEMELESAKPREEVFDLTKKEFKDESKKFLEKFKDNIKEITEKTTGDITKDLIELTAKEENLTNIVKDLAYDYLQQAESDDETNIKEYEVKEDGLYIAKVEIKNFQSHEHSILEFDKGYNCIIGENGKGKTSIMRALEWCLTNSLKGEYFITTNKDECSVKITLSDDSYIERYRTRKSAGGYNIRTSWGELLELKGFGSEVPVEVINEHQMPFVNLAKGLVKTLNIARQSENVFLLEESPSVKASAVGKLVGSDNIDLTIKNVSTDIKSLNKDIKSLNNSILSKTNELANYSDLDKMKQKIDKIDKLMEKYTTLNNELLEIKRFKDAIINIRKNKEILNNQLNEIKNIDIKKAQEKIDYIDAILIDELYDLSSYNKKLESLKTNRKHLNEELVNLPDESVLEQKILGLEYILEELEIVNNYRQKRIDVYKPKMKLTKEIQLLDSQIKTNEKELIVLEQELKTYLRENNVCPTCNSELDDTKIEHIINN